MSDMTASDTRITTSLTAESLISLLTLNDEPLPTSSHWYAIADSAQHHELPHAIDGRRDAVSLFGASLGSPIAAQSPWLVELPSPSAESKAWRWIARHGQKQPACITLLASELTRQLLHGHLQRCTQVVLPENHEMALAFWDPAILGTLVGQADDLTLHVRGPVLSDRQHSLLVRDIQAWWYWSREATFHRLVMQRKSSEAVSVDTFTLDQSQVDALVEASVPDHVLHHLQINQPLLLEPIKPSQRYRAVQTLIQHARETGLEAMRDVVNFCCAGLIYGDRMRNEESIVRALSRVKQRQCTLDAALLEFPE